MNKQKPGATPPAPDNSPQQGPGNTTKAVDTYLDKLIHYIPGDLVAAYLTLDGLLRGGNLVHSDILYWIVFGALLLLTPFYVIYRPTSDSIVGQSQRFDATAATIAFAVWVFALGGPFSATWPNLYNPVYGSILLVITTLIMPVTEKIATKVPFFRQ